MGNEGLSQLKRLANNVGIGNKILSSVEEGKEDEEIPDLVENFENVANIDAKTNDITNQEAEKKIEDIAIEIANSTIQDTTASLATEKANDDKKESKKEPTQKKTNDKGKKQQSKDKKI